MLGVARDANDSHPRALPQLLVFELRYGHVVVSAQSVFQAPQNLPLVLEGPRVGDMNFQGEEADRHFRPIELN